MEEPDATPLDPDELAGLKLTHIQTRGDLDLSGTSEYSGWTALVKKAEKYRCVVRRIFKTLAQGDAWRCLGMGGNI